MAVSPVPSQHGTVLDDDIEAAWGREFGTPGVTGSVYRLHTLPDGRLMAIGAMSFIKGVDTHGFGVWDGSTWSTWLTQDDVRLNSISAVHPLADGSLVLSGNLELDGRVREGVFAFDGQEWSALGFPDNDFPRALGSLAADDVYAGTCGGSSAGYFGSGIQHWTGTSWSTIGTMDCVGSVFALSSGDVYVVGMDERWGPTYMARFRDGVQQEIIPTAAVDVVEAANGTVYALFPNSRGAPSFVARRDEGAWTPLPGGENTDALRWHPDGRLLSLTRPDHDGGFRLLAWNGFAWDTLYDDTADPLLNGHFNDVQIHPEWGIVAAGSIAGRTNPSILHVAAFQNGHWHPMTGGGGLNDGVSTLKAWGDSLIVAGGFSRAGTVPVNRLAIWHDGNWSGFDSQDGSGPGSINDIAVAQNGDIWAAGSYRNADRSVESGVFRWNGSVWDIPNGGVTGNGNWQDGYAIGTSVLTRDDGSVVVGGWFAEAGGQPAVRLASWKAGVWTPIDLPLETLDFQSRITTLSECPDESILVGLWGTRQSDGTLPLLRWDGTSWSTLGRFTRDGGDYVAINVIDCTEDEVVAGGIFDGVDGVTTRNIARFNGTTWSDLQDGTNGGVRAMTRDYAGNLVVSGDFRWAGTTYSARVARWMGDSWQAFGAGTEFDGDGNQGVGALASIAPDQFYLAGRFSRVGTVDATHIARFDFTKVDPGFEHDPDDPADSIPPNAFELSVFPNPGPSSQARVRIRVPETDVITLRVFDMTGQLIAEPWTGQLREAGTYEVPLSNLDSLPAGMYWVRVEGASSTATTSWVQMR